MYSYKLLICGLLFLCSSVKSDETTNEALCELLKFRPKCRSASACSKDSVDGTACGVKFDSNGNPTFVSASRAASTYYDSSYGTVDTTYLGNLKTVESLFLYGSGLTTLDDSISSLTSLKSLYIQNNSLKNLPEHFGNLKNLEVLQVYRNSLSEIPESISSLTNLKRLDFNKNYGLTEVKANLENLVNLTQLSIFSCSLKNAPSLSGMKNLKYLDLSYNHFTTIGMGIGDLTSLEVLDLSHSSLTGLPDSISSLTSLKSLKIENNNFDSTLTSSMLCLLTKNISIKVTSDYRCMNTRYALDVKTWYAQCKLLGKDRCGECPLCELSGSKCKLRNPSNCPFDEKKVSGEKDDDNTAVTASVTVCVIVFVLIVLAIIGIIIYRNNEYDYEDEIEMDSLTSDGLLDSVEQINFNDLVLETKIGEGSFGVVYKGTYKGGIVAIKETKGIDSEALRLDFQREYQVMSQLRSPYIVELIGIVNTPEKLCIVTEFMILGSLDSALRKKKSAFTPKYRIRVCRDVALGLDFLHTSGVIHRDLKPGNILIVSFSEDAPVMCKITDFGTSRTTIKEATVNLTKGLGTPQYMAPEILKGEGNNKYASKADVYSFGILAYEVLCCTDPYDGSQFTSYFKLSDHIISGNRPDLSKLEIFSDCSNLIEKCWDDDPVKRPDMSEAASYFSKKCSSFK